MRTSVLIRMPNWLGDIVMATSAIEALYRTGKYELHLLIRPPWDELFRNDPRVREVNVCRDRGLELFSQTAELRRQKVDTVIDFTHSARTRILWKLGGLRKIYRENPAMPDSHQVSRYLATVQPLLDEIPNVPWPPQVVAPPDSHKSEIRNPKSEILLFPAAAFGPAKMWSTARYRDLVKALAARNWPVRLVGTKSEEAFLEELACGRTPYIPVAFDTGPSMSGGFSGQSAGGTQIRTSTGLSLTDLMRLIVSARAVISCDSGAAHLAAALGRPTVVLFFSTDPARTLPIGYAVRAVSAAVPCRPCFLRTCPIGYLCRDAVTPRGIITQLEDLFDLP